jgi:hypothetical protein
MNFLFAEFKNFTHRMKEKGLRADLNLLQQQIETVKDRFCMDEHEKIILQKDLETLYTKYTATAYKFIKHCVKDINNRTFVERELSYFGWHQIVNQIDLYVKGDETNG